MPGATNRIVSLESVGKRRTIVRADRPNREQFLATPDQEYRSAGMPKQHRTVQNG